MKKDLLKGRKYCYSNNHLEIDDYRGAEVYYNSRFNNFGIIFNGSCIYTCKTFISLEKRLNKLIDKWSLIFQEVIE